MLTINIISDVSCPWCIIGYQSLNAAIKQLGAEKTIELTWKPFELNPDMPQEGQQISEHIQQKYGATPEQSAANRLNITARGAEVGYAFTFAENARIYNTFDAHRLLHWAKEHGLQTELKLELFDLYFQRQGNPSKQADLLDCAAKVGLNTEKAREILNSDEFADEVRRDLALNSQLGISAVPAFIFNNTHLVSGGQPQEVFMNVLQELHKETA